MAQSKLESYLFGNRLLKWLTNFSAKPTEGAPLGNEYSAVEFLSYPFGIEPETSYESLWTSFKDSPEVFALVSAIIEDVISDGWRLHGGRNNVLRAEKFLRKNHAKEAFTSMLYDMFVTGDGYLYKVALNEGQVKSVIGNVFERVNTLYGCEYKSNVSGMVFDEIKAFDEDIFSVRSFQSVASSTMRAKYDIHGDVHEWIQRVGSKAVKFEPDEIIHMRMSRLNGKFYGFTPMQTISSELETIDNIKDLANSIFGNGGVPNHIFKLPDIPPNSPAHKSFMEALRQFYTTKNKYRSLVVCGNVEHKELVRSGKDMEFRELSKYFTQILFMVWGVPPSRLGGTMTDGKTSRADVMTNEGYYRKISHYQDLLEDVVNNYLLKSFDVVLELNRSYKQDEVREIQNQKIMTDIVEQRLRLGLVNEKWAWEYLDIGEEYRGDGVEEEKSGLLNQGKLNQHQVLTASPEKAFDDKLKQSISIQNKEGVR